MRLSITEKSIDVVLTHFSGALQVHVEKGPSCENRSQNEPTLRISANEREIEN